MTRFIAALVLAVLGFTLVAAAPSETATRIDPAFPAYETVPGVSGTVKSIGSDTMLNLMTRFSEAFNARYPSVRFEIEGKGSSTAPPALIEGQAQFGPMSRAMKPSEIDQFEKRHGYKPLALRVAVDTLAVYVHKDNPIESISLGQLARVYTLKGGNVTWGDLGLSGEWADKPVSLYGRNSASGTYGFFKEAIGGADFKPTVKEQPGSSAVIQGVANDKFAIGYSGIGYRTADVRVVPVSRRDGGEAFPPAIEYAYDGSYPLARFLYVYINHEPGSTVDPLRREFIRLMFSREGQEVVLKDGYDPVPVDVAREDLESIGVDPGF